MPFFDVIGRRPYRYWPDRDDNRSCIVGKVGSYDFQPLPPLGYIGPHHQFFPGFLGVPWLRDYLQQSWDRYQIGGDVKFSHPLSGLPRRVRIDYANSGPWIVVLDVVNDPNVDHRITISNANDPTGQYRRSKEQHLYTERSTGKFMQWQHDVWQLDPYPIPPATEIDRRSTKYRRITGGYPTGQAAKIGTGQEFISGGSDISWSTNDPALNALLLTYQPPWINLETYVLWDSENGCFPESSEPPFQPEPS